LSPAARAGCRVSTAHLIILRIATKDLVFEVARSVCLFSHRATPSRDSFDTFLLY